jgi:hypothetical protein
LIHQAVQPQLIEPLQPLVDGRLSSVKLLVDTVPFFAIAQQPNRLGPVQFDPWRGL